MSLTFRLAVTLLVGFAVNLAGTPLIIRLAHRHRWYDEQNHRKIHTENIPRLGGIGIFLGMVASAALALLLSPVSPETVSTGDIGSVGRAGFAAMLGYYGPALGGMALIFAVGLVDDFRNLRAVLKLAVQVLAAALVTIGPFTIDRITIPFIWYNIELGVLGYPVTIVWIVAVSNAVNLIDGIDGLAGGTSAIAMLFFAIIGLLVGEGVPTLLAVGIFGSLLAFLVYNGPPAKIFMGDAGSYVLGFSLAVFPLILAGGTGSSLDLIPAITLLAIPLVDMTSSVLRRMRRGKHPFSPDREHIHHRLMDRGYGPWKILAIVYGAAVVLGVIAVTWYLIPKNPGTALSIAVWAVGIGLVAWLTVSARRNPD